MHACRKLTTPVATTGPYHGNSRSKVYHAAGCQYYDCKNCTVGLASAEALPGSVSTPGVVLCTTPHAGFIMDNPHAPSYVRIPAIVNAESRAS